MPDEKRKLDCERDGSTLPLDLQLFIKSLTWLVLQQGSELSISMEALEALDQLNLMGRLKDGRLTLWLEDSEPRKHEAKGS